MKNQVEYQFDQEPNAYRFLNTVSNWEVPGLKVKFGQSSYHVRIVYELQQNGFDTTLSELDNLAANENGVEIN